MSDARLGDRGITGTDLLLVAAAIVILLVVLLSAMFGALAIAGQFHKKITLGMVIGANLISVIAVLVPVQMLILRRKGLDWPSFGFRPVERRVIALSAFAACGLILCAAVLRLAFDVWDDRDMARIVAPAGFGIFSMVVMIGLTGVAMPFAEEVFFRGVLYRWLRSRLAPALAIPASAVIFAVSHLQYTPVLMAMVGALGCAFAYGYERTGSLWVPVVMHATNNSIGVALIYASIA